ncbi:hypothetical protein LNV23_12885 [Paucibacter sp. DJ1R-11]|uniref:sensor histidine kinase n=1 Tax=Paucibacter sp. DJ1R-11 TaxID=2893556 RepID=UPI0021E45E04|nr:ATP-binding protein [Paucibacter sp. DJ1R-11]MCV2364340.1 hypothetical protein [Paucibacter sp. DJ1R-11]
MNSSSDARVSTRRLPRRAAAATLALLLAGVSLLSLAWFVALQELVSLSWTVSLLTVFCTGLLFLLVAGLGWHVGVRLTRQRLHDSLREARQHSRLMSQLQTDWQWATDAEHHLVRWQGPREALSSQWVGHSTCQALWERFHLLSGAEGSATGSLRELLGQQRQEFELQVQAVDGAPHSGLWLLHGLARWDAQGCFEGYCGSARPLQELALPLDLPPPVLSTAWLEALPGPAWLLSVVPPVLLLAQNSQAAAAGARVGERWQDCQGQFSAGLCERLSGHLPRAYTDASGSYALALLPPVTAPALPPPSDAGEHESFSYTVSHDLRAPLRVVEGFARILKEDYGRLLDRIGNDHLDRVMGAAARMNSMIDSLLSLSQLSAQPLARQPVDLSQLAGFVVEELRRSAPERSVTVHIQPRMVAQGDPTLLRMVLENLLGNAWKYSGKCAQAQIRFEAQLEEGQWTYRISDNGAGFDMRFADRLFGVFQRLHSASDFQGTGVGLASVRRIVRRHGGDIWAESAVGEGARFYFTLAG